MCFDCPFRTIQAADDRFDRQLVMVQADQRKPRFLRVVYVGREVNRWFRGVCSIWAKGRNAPSRPFSGMSR
ncbi:hypothetical protein F4Y59_02975 [Candidatus Poribacteria bacterium]|nr:hypothetical protein [Candidatus Poribacteria bacterium]MYK19471.1 hypothetical protein [Candidatus Poribacteria bacterium]